MARVGPQFVVGIYLFFWVWDSGNCTQLLLIRYATGPTLGKYVFDWKINSIGL